MLHLYSLDTFFLWVAREEEMNKNYKPHMVLKLSMFTSDVVNLSSEREKKAGKYYFSFYAVIYVRHNLCE